MSLTAAFLTAVSLFTGGSDRSAEENLRLFTANAPMPQIVARGTELAAAEAAAERQRGCIAVNGAGSSMEPVYLSGTAVVIHVGGYQTLRRGMPVVYSSRTGKTVAHMLVTKTDDGWVAAGLANDNADDELVTPENFVGVITQAFASKVGTLPRSIATRAEPKAEKTGTRS